MGVLGLDFVAREFESLEGIDVAEDIDHDIGLEMATFEEDGSAEVGQLVGGHFHVVDGIDGHPVQEGLGLGDVWRDYRSEGDKLVAEDIESLL